MQKVLTGRLQPRPSTDTIILSSSVRTTPTAVGRLSCVIPVFTNEPLQFEATTMTWAHHPTVLHDDQDQRAARIFRDLKTDRRVCGDLVVHGCEPVAHNGAVHCSHPLGTGRRGTRTQYHSLAQVVLRCGGYQPLRLLGATNQEKCSFKSKRMMNPVTIRRCGARSSVNCCEEVTGGTSLCTMKPSKWNGTRGGWRCSPAPLPPRTRVPCPRLQPTGEGGFLGVGLLGLDEPVEKETKIGARNPPQQPCLQPTRGFRATPEMTAFAFAPRKPCNLPRIAVVRSAQLDQKPKTKS